MKIVVECVSPIGDLKNVEIHLEDLYEEKRGSEINHLLKTILNPLSDESSTSSQGSLLAGLYLPVEPTTGHSKNRYATSIWATLWMSSSGTSLTANVEILGFMGNSIGLVYCGRWLLELVGFVPLPQRLLLTSTRVCHPLPTLTGEAGSQLASLLPG
ncbi:hypothetical protein J6590_059019 [Homalodisca vitripennis]|nr:hypothetical protein J6590_059019 [Homalodisca vitripennis]